MGCLLRVILDRSTVSAQCLLVPQHRTYRCVALSDVEGNNGLMHRNLAYARSGATVGWGILSKPSRRRARSIHAVAAGRLDPLLERGDADGAENHFVADHIPGGADKVVLGAVGITALKERI